MNTCPRQILSFLLVALTIAVSPTAASGFPAADDVGGRKASIPPDEYRQRRQALIEKLEPHSVAVFISRTPAVRSNDVNYRYRQESNLLYLTGLTEPGGFLLLSTDDVQLPDSTVAREILFVQPASPNQVTGDALGVEGAKSELGFQHVLERGEFEKILAQALDSASILYYNPELPDLLVDYLTGDRIIRSRRTKELLAGKYPNLSVKRISRELAELRTVKSESELQLMQRAIDATAEGHIEAMKSCEPGMYEYELQSIVEFCFGMEGCEYQGFPSIIGSGPNSCILHYEENERQMKAGDLVVLDIGAEYGGYSADITRTIPVSGTFSKEQRKLYDLVLSAQNETIAQAGPGVKMSLLNEKAREVIGKGLKALKIIDDESEVRKYFVHGVGHSLGLDVHDIGVYGAVLEPGMVITVEPGVYIPEGSPCDKKYWNIGIRIEDDVLVTEQGRRVLSSGAPKSADEIESLMKKKGIGNERRGVK